MRTFGVCHCGRRVPEAPSEYPNVCDQWPLCERPSTDPAWQPCAACNAEPGEPCRPGCLGYALDHDQL